MWEDSCMKLEVVLLKGLCDITEVRMQMKVLLNSWKAYMSEFIVRDKS